MGEMKMDENQLEEMLSAAYLCGVAWGRFNPDSDEYPSYSFKAAADYADATVTVLTGRSTSKEEGNG